MYFKYCVGKAELNLNLHVVHCVAFLPIMSKQLLHRAKTPWLCKQVSFVTP